MPPYGGKPPGKGRNRGSGIGSAVLHQCLRKQAERTQSHLAFVQSLKDERDSIRASLSPSPAGVALGGTISRHRTLEFLSGALGIANPAKGSAQSKHSEQHLRSIIERSGLDEYISTALAAQDNFLVDRYATRLLQEPTAPHVVPKNVDEDAGRRKDFFTEGGDVPIPRRAVLFSREMADACKKADSQDRPRGVSHATRNRRRRNRARVNLLLGGKVEEATIYNVQFVRQQRDELHRRFQKAKDAKTNKRPGRQAKPAAARGRELGAGDAVADLEDKWGSDTTETVNEVEGEESNEEIFSDSEAGGDTDDASSAVSSSVSSSMTAEDGDTASSPPPSHSEAPQFPKTAAELDEVEMDEFLRWRRKLASMEEQGVVLTPYERNIEVWRQLWRVIERSDIVLQIVDGRSPMFFRCKDLEKYIKEVSAEKRVRLL